MKNYRLKICKICGEQFKPITGHQFYCKECGIIVKREYIKQYYRQYNKQWKLEHPEYEHEWYLENKEQKKQYMKKYELEHREQIKQYAEQWVKDNRDRHLEIKRKAQYKRYRNLGFIPLNSYKSYEKGYVFHHFDETGYGVYMLEEDHTSIPHSVLQNRNMDAINALAFNSIGGELWHS